MAKYDATKFYWLQLKEDFFEDDAISWLEEQQPNGRDYAYFYLKLCLKSLKSNGILIRKVGNILIPYDNKKLAELTKMDFDTVTIAMELLKKIGLVQILDSGAIYINQLENLIGSQSISAFKKQQQRLLKNDGGGQMSPKCPLEIDIEKELDIDINKKENNIKEKKFIKPTLEEIEQYVKEKKLDVNAKQFFDYFEVGNWIDSKGNKVRNWKQKILTWNSHREKIKTKEERNREEMERWLNE